MYLTHFQIVLLAGVPLTILLTAFLIMIKLASERDQAILDAATVYSEMLRGEKLLIESLDVISRQQGTSNRELADELATHISTLWSRA